MHWFVKPVEASSKRSVPGRVVFSRERSVAEVGDREGRKVAEVAERDDIWRPDYDGPPPVSGSVAFAPRVVEETAGSTGRDAVHLATEAGGTVGPVGGADAERRFDREANPPAGATFDGRPDGHSDHAMVGSSRRWSVEQVVAIVAVLAMSIAAVAVVLGDSGLASRAASDAGDVGEITSRTSLSGFATPFDGADFRSLPTAVEPLWRTQFPPLSVDGGQNGITWIEAVDSDHVVIGMGDSRSESSSVVRVVDARTGELLWTQQFESRIDWVDVVAAIDDVLVLSAEGSVSAYALADGSLRWGYALLEFDGVPATIERLAGTDYLLLTGAGPSRSLGVVDPRDGRSVSSFEGELLGSDGTGRWYVRRGDKIKFLDFNDPIGGIADFGLAATVDGDRTDFAAIVDRRLVVGLDDELAHGPLTDSRGRLAQSGGFTPLLSQGDAPAGVPIVQTVFPLGGPTFAAAGGGVVTGAEFVGDDVEFGWSRDGVVASSYPTRRGNMLLLSTNGGAGQTLVDGRTGDTITTITMTTGALDVFDVVGDGVVVRRPTRDGTSIVGLDLDGEVVWSLDGAGPVSVGDGIVLRPEVLPNGSFTVTAFG